VIVLPDISDKAGFISKLFVTVLPELAPHLFPHIEEGRWTHFPEYELPVVRELIARQAEIQERANAEVSTLQNQIERERELNGWMHDLLVGTDRRLVEAVKVGLGNWVSPTSLISTKSETKRARQGEKTSKFTTLHRHSS
jgi:hypothetical protein